MEYIRGLPINDTPEMFGLHDNANITFAVNETYQLLNGIVKLQPKSKSGGGRSQEEVGQKTKYYYGSQCILGGCDFLKGFVYTPNTWVKVCGFFSTSCT